MQYAFRGKVAVLVDEMTSSDAEIFAAGVQQLGLGAVVGARTWGGAVGYSSNPELALVDGSGFTIPSFGPYVSGKWMIEQRGVVPDIAVANDPVATFNGKDAQLDAAVNHFVEAGQSIKAIQAAMECRQWQKAAGIVEALDPNTAAPFFKRIARHYESARDLEAAERYYIRGLVC